MPYAILSDLHFHNWSQFSSVNNKGLNSRLEITIAELHRACQILRDRGSVEVIIPGDIFHVRGSIDPEVFNPVHDAFVKESNWGMKFTAMPGNHDLKGKDASSLGNAFTSLGLIHNFLVLNSTLDIKDKIFIPWMSNINALRDEIARVAVKGAGCDLFIHAGIDGVITGVPEHGLTASDLAGYGFKRVFAGHYHHHKIMEGGKVISIGATTQQTFSDLGAKAGFLIVDGDEIEFHATHAPSFVEVNDTTPEEDIPIIVDGNFVRVRGLKLTDQQTLELRKSLMDMNAAGVRIEVARHVVSARPTAVTPTKGVSLESSIYSYAEEICPDDIDVNAIKVECLDILTSVQTIS